MNYYLLYALRRLRGYPPESQERVEVGSADEEASPPPGSARVDYIHHLVRRSSSLHSQQTMESSFYKMFS